ncbi:TonB-dependent receptor domain-containing protein [Gluconobacter wancherniae]|uniref:TonB-dependent receptor n=1 Tax=Gluconobacter wancherniae NBRC 103581 TaxID=656744 RepID=A0A511B214_9PROT|nr:TonB-dependent receptor [Gluconobacter wancherniae]MBF0854482.1 TonB-dependent receptor [Gluconobacter wancherniae]GBD57544.1 TonB-dependent receptor [Gluconobacter wancherniae NBRC 103581]GBR62862.1 TonB-dependent outer membrane receptor [Gluconobacter wancherniae NBRC 103581]GEK93683.1 TonB-dependent receptor [Gluconobacter wancherniae NBRC 103581]
MNTSRHVFSKKTPQTVLKMLLMAGISYAAVPVCHVQAQETAKHSGVVHKHVTKKKKAVVTAPVTIAPAAHTTTTISATPTPSKVTAVNSAVIQSSSPEQVTVTGTRLSQTRLTNVMAGTSIDATQLAARGYTNLGLALLRENPAFSVPSNSQIGSQGSFGAGQTFSGLFGLGDQRTLTLIDGMRMVGGATSSMFGSSSGSQVDVGTIPTSLVKKIDSQYGGAGAAYGADAIGGVVNYQLDDHFTGVDFNAQGNFTQKLDAPQEKIVFKAGTSFDHGKGGVVFDVEYRNSGGMVANDRPNITGYNGETYRRAAVGTTSPYTYMLTRDTRFAQVSTSGIPTLSAAGGVLPLTNGRPNTAIAGANGSALMFSQDGKSLIPLTYDTAIAGNRYTTGGNGLSLAQYNQLFTPSNSLNLTTLGHYDFTDHLHATWQGWYQRGTASSTVGQGTWSTPMFGDDPLTQESYRDYSDVNGAYSLSTNNPYLTPAERTTIVNALAAAGKPTDTFYMSKLNQDLDSALFTTTNQMFRFAGGLNGDFDAVSRNFHWSIKGEYSKYLNDTVEPMINTQNLLNALNSTIDSNGNIVCAPNYTNSSARTRSSTCSPLNPFGNGQMTTAARDYVISDANSKNSNAQRDLQAEIGSTVLTLPAGDVRWDIGYEHRREGYNFNPGSFMQGELQTDGTYKQYGNFIPIQPVSGAYHTHEAFGELDVPIVSPQMHVPGIYNLSATANGRFTNNSMTGNYWTYMFGASWWPTKDFGLYGNYAQSVRNPSVTELFAPQGQEYATANDPCSQEFLGSGPNPAIRAANCAKAGIPTNFESDIVNQTVPGKSGGNRHLQNETSKSYTGTLELRPHFIPGFDLKASFIDVKIQNEITSLSVGDLMAACYDSSSYPSGQYCQSFTRDSNHQVTDYTAGYYNIANEHMQALQAHLGYYLPLRRLGLPSSAGALELDGNYTHYVKLAQTYLGSTYQGVGTTGQTRDAFTTNLNYTRGPLFVQWQTIYYGPSHYAVQVAESTYQNNKRSDFAYFNTTIGYKITKNFDVNFMMNNVTNALPAYANTVSLTRYYDVLLGRSFQLAIGAHF